MENEKDSRQRLLEMKQESFQEAIVQGDYHSVLAIANDTKQDFPEEGTAMLEQLRSIPLDLFTKKTLDDL